MAAFCIADLHFGHKNVLTFAAYDDPEVRLRPQWTKLEEMHEALIDNWNSVVGKNDMVYVLGDVSFKSSLLHAIMPRLKGMKNLAMGNHEYASMADYMQHFERIHSLFQIEVGEKKRVILTHLPVHPSQLEYRWKANIHGHLHNRYVKDHYGDPDLRYFNVSVEAIDYKPIPFETIIEILKRNNPSW